MQLYTFAVFSPADNAAAVPVEVVLDILYAHALPADGLEHVRVRAGPGRLDVTLFLRVDGPAHGHAVAGELFERALRASPLFANWLVVPTYQ